MICKSILYNFKKQLTQNASPGLSSQQLFMYKPVLILWKDDISNENALSYNLPAVSKACM